MTEQDPKATEEKKKPAKRRAKAKSKTADMISPTDFKTWLEGVESMQPDDWAPDKEQWKIIRKKISLVKEEPPAANFASAQRASVSSQSAPAPSGQGPVMPIEHEPPQSAQQRPMITTQQQKPSFLKPANSDGLIDASPKNAGDGPYESSFGA